VTSTGASIRIRTTTGRAGTYSDSKLYTRSHERGDVHDMIGIVAIGAPHDLRIDAWPQTGLEQAARVITALCHTWPWSRRDPVRARDRVRDRRARRRAARSAGGWPTAASVPAARS
jgi:hypothetical protein